MPRSQQTLFSCTILSTAHITQHCFLPRKHVLQHRVAPRRQGLESGILPRSFSDADVVLVLLPLQVVLQGSLISSGGCSSMRGAEGLAERLGFSNDMPQLRFRLHIIVCGHWWGLWDRGLPVGWPVPESGVYGGGCTLSSGNSGTHPLLFQWDLRARNHVEHGAAKRRLWEDRDWWWWWWRRSL